MALPIVQIVAGVALAAVLIYAFKDKISGRKNIADKAQSIVEDTSDAALDAAESVVEKAQSIVEETADAVLDAADSVVDKAIDVVKDVKRSVT